MKAAVLDQIGDDKVTGTCHSHLFAVNGTLPALVPGTGYEGAGEIVAVGSAVDHLAVGDHAIVTFVPLVRQISTFNRTSD